jgi:hypothetical protein
MPLACVLLQIRQKATAIAQFQPHAISGSILRTEALIFKKLMATADDSTLTCMRLILGWASSSSHTRKRSAGSAARFFGNNGILH